MIIAIVNIFEDFFLNLVPGLCITGG